MEGALFLDIVIRKSSAIFQLLSGEDQPLLIWGNALLILDLGLDILDGVGGLHLQGDGLAGQGLHEDLHTAAETEHEMQGALLLDVVVRKGPAVLKLLAGKDQPLLIGRDALLILNLGLDIFDSVGGLDLQGDGLASQGLHEDLHAASETEHKMQGALLLNVVVRKGPAILKLLAGKDQPLLIGRDALLILDLGLDVLDGVRGLDLEGDSLAGEGLDENLHDAVTKKETSISNTS